MDSPINYGLIEMEVARLEENLRGRAAELEEKYPVGKDDDFDLERDLEENFWDGDNNDTA